VRLDLAPTYTRLAIEKNALSVIAVLEKSSHLDDSAEAYAAYDWRLQHHLTVTSENHVYTLIFNSFAQFYEQLARRYFVPVESRRRSDDYYRELLAIAQNQDLPKAETVTRHIMQMSIELWKYATETTGELS
jgi:GntR family negative regulator for fad regulon and positive regulator of fabA